MAIKLNSTQIQNAKLIVIALNKYGVTDPNVQAGILATCYKETGFIPRSEVSYRNTSASRIRLVFGSLFSKYTDAQIDEIKKDDNKFWEVVYGHRGGNNLDGDGAKYRAKGFNGLTFKPNYLRYGNIIGVDLVKYPEKANEPEVASEICAVYFRDVINYGFKIGASKIDDEPGMTGINVYNVPREYVEILEKKISLLEEFYFKDKIHFLIPMVREALPLNEINNVLLRQRGTPSMIAYSANENFALAA